MRMFFQVSTRRDYKQYMEQLMIPKSLLGDHRKGGGGSFASGRTSIFDVINDDFIHSFDICKIELTVINLIQLQYASNYDKNRYLEFYRKQQYLLNSTAYVVQYQNQGEALSSVKSFDSYVFFNM